MEIAWKDIDEIAFQLYESCPDQDPLVLSFPDLLSRILALPGFTGERQYSNEARLEAIQMAWLAEYKE
jgi:FeS assembly protein IscX